MLLLVAVLAGVVLYGNSQVLKQLWSWGALLSPSFYLYISMSMGAVLEPLYACWELPARIIRSRHQGFWISASAGFVALLIELFKIGVALFVSWGAFPIEVDPEAAQAIPACRATCSTAARWCGIHPSCSVISISDLAVQSSLNPFAP
jgi:hypothetical protein